MTYKAAYDQMQFLEKQHFRVMTAIEQGMKNHESVAIPLIYSIAQLKNFNIHTILNDLLKQKLVQRVNKGLDGFTLSFRGYDYLALHTLFSRDIILSIGGVLGCGKEADIYRSQCRDGSPCIIKIHHLGRTSFKTLKLNRDFHGNKSHTSWIYISRLSCAAEFKFMKLLRQKQMPIPKPFDSNRNALVMEQIEGTLLNKIDLSEDGYDPLDLCNQCLDFIQKMASFGLVHGDFNEFNILVKDNKKEIVVIDFPQVISVYAENAEKIFQRDVAGIVSYFSKYGIEFAEIPKLSEIECLERLDYISRASGFKNCNVMVKETLENIKQYAEFMKNEEYEIKKMFDEAGGEHEKSDADPQSLKKSNWIDMKVKREMASQQKQIIAKNLRKNMSSNAKRKSRKDVEIIEF